MKLFTSLTNRIFVASALLAVVSIGVAMVIVNLAVLSQAERELRRGLHEAGTLLEEYRGLRQDHVSREARLIADLPRLKAAVAPNDPPTVRPIAEEYQQQLGADLFLVTDRHGGRLALIATEGAAAAAEGLPTIAIAAQGGEASTFVAQEGGILQVVSVPIWIDPRQPEILGTLTVGVSLDGRAASRVRGLTNSEIAFAIDGRIQASTLPAAAWPALTPLLAGDGIRESVSIGHEEYIALTRPLVAGRAPAGAADAEPRAQAVVLRSRTERLRFLSTVHGTLAVTAVGALLAAILISYATARTVTRPLAAVTATMREMAATGDLTRRITHPPGRWEDEDASLLASTFNAMTDSIERFQREAAQRERLSALGRLSTVIAHEIRNPLMIIKTVLRSLRGGDVTPAQLRGAVADIDEEVARLNRIVTEVLDFARPIRFQLSPADLNALCRDAAEAAVLTAAAAPPHAAPSHLVTPAAPAAGPVAFDLDPALPPIVTDGERLRLALVNVLANAREGVTAGGAGLAPGAITVATAAAGADRVAITVRDRGAGIAAEDLPRVFDPYFTTRRTGTGLGLAISRNIVEGLGGTIGIASRAGEGTDVRIELPIGPPQGFGIRDS